MARYQFKLPDIGEGIAEAEIVAWHIKVGDTVGEDQQIADMMTDKATVEMESPVAGKVVSLAGEVGDQIPIGSVLVEFEVEGEAPAEEAREDTVALSDGLVEPTEAQEKAIPVVNEAPAVRPEPVEGLPSSKEEGKGFDKLSPNGEGAKKAVQASPAVRQRARDLGIDLTRVKYAGDRVRHADLDAYLLYNGGGVAGGPVPRRADETIKVVGLRRKIAENMQEAKRRIPHFTLVEEYDVTALEQTRAMMNRDRGDNPKLTMLPFLITAFARMLARYPQINATYDDDAQVVTRHGAVHMGMATQTPNGLMVAVIRDAQGRDLWNLAAEVARLADAARTGKASREELSGSTFTISSLGPMGGITSTPVINRPEVGIVAVNKVREAPVVVDGDLEIRKLMNLSLSCDHRVVDGWDAAEFMRDLKGLIENPLKLLST
ncbi:MAG: 2-oxo acid dehydrogenase subunit E2 [Sphingomonas sp.]|nr:2-oxo acid dehydrogenase subunit E2 [Sphingomonas sp.]